MEQKDSANSEDVDRNQGENPLMEKEVKHAKTSISQIWENIVRMGLGEISLKIGMGIASVSLVLLVVWVMGSFYLKGDVKKQSAALAAPALTATPKAQLPDFEVPNVSFITSGITRISMLHTQLPARPRYEITTYTVQKGDTVYDIATQFNLQPQTILWGNLNTLGDNPNNISPGEELNILPQDGVLYAWHEGDGLNGVAKYFDVPVDTILDWPGNHLNRETIGDYSHPNIEVGTEIFVPGGVREFNTWSAPLVTRSNPAVAKLYGPGACGSIYDGPVGNATFVWPSTSRLISGYDYAPEINHPAIDIGGTLGNAIYAVDAGVVVYSGWNDYGYGYVIVVDHGNGWQSLYAHLSVIYSGCGAAVYQGDTIGLMGSTGNSTGPHLHFELRSDLYGKINPHQFLQ